MLIHYWHSLLNMPKHDLAWHKKDIEDEKEELAEASGFISIWSEISDIVYTYTRAKWSGHKIKRPLNIFKFYYGAVYMFPKYTLRWLFYRKVGNKFDNNIKISEVRNPRKTEKLHVIAEKYNINPEEFKKECLKLSRYWVFLK